MMSKEDSRQFLLIPHSIEIPRGPQLCRMCKMPKDADCWSYGRGGVGEVNAGQGEVTLQLRTEG